MSIKLKIYKKIARYSTNAQLIYVILAILILEFCTMLLMGLLPPMPLLLSAAIDCLILSILLAPGIYLIIRKEAKFQIERQRNRETLKERETHFYTLANSGQALIWTAGLNKQCDYLNQPWLDFTGRNLEQEIGDGWITGVHSDDRKQYLDTYNRSFLNRVRFSTELRLLHTSGEYRWIRNDGTPRYSSNGQFIGYIGHCLDIHVSKQEELYREMTGEILQILNGQTDTGELIHQVVNTLKARTGFDAIAIRLQKDNDFPYVAQEGFSNEFLHTENTLAEHLGDDQSSPGENGAVCLACICGRVISGNGDPGNPFFTPRGSWWINDSSQLLNQPFDKDHSVHPHNQCIHQGYASIALVPIRDKEKVIGLVQLNSKHTDRFSNRIIEKLEGIASHIGTTLARKQAETALRASEERLKSILETAMDGFWLVDCSGRLLQVNETYCRMSGYSMSELLAMNIADLESIENEDSILERIEKIKLKGEDRFETSHYRKDGSIFDVEISVQYQPLEGGRFVAFLHDITNRKLAEEKLRQSEKRYKSLFQENHSVMLLIDPETGMIADANPAACEYYGWTHDEICGKNIFEVNTLSKEEIEKELLMAKNEMRNHFLFKHRLANGEDRDVEVYSGPILFGEKTMLYSIVHDITERKKVEELLKEKDELLNKAQEIAQLGSWSLTFDNNQLTWSDEVYRIFGIPPQEFSASYEKFLDVVHPEDRDAVNEAYLQSVREAKDGFEMEHRIIRIGSGEVRYVLEKCKHLKNTIGEVIRSVGMIHDITEQKLIEKALRENERLLRESQEVAHVGSYAVNMVDRIWKASTEVYKIFGIDQTYPHTLNGWIETIHPDFKDELIKDLVHAEDENTLFEHEYKIYRVADKKERWVHGLGRFEFNEHRKPVRLIGTIQDITSRKLVEEEVQRLNEELEERVEIRTAELLDSYNALQKAEEKYRTVADFTYDWEYWMNPEGQFNYISPSCERITGYKPAEFIQNPSLLSGIIHPDDLPFVQKQEARNTKNNYHEFRLRIIKADGSVRWLKHIHRSIFNVSGHHLGIRGSFRDITARKTMEDLLKTSNRKYRLLSRNISDGIFISKNGIFDYVNNAMAFIFGLTELEMNGMELEQILHPECLDELKSFSQAQHQMNKKKTFEAKCKRLDQSTIIVEFILNYVAKEQVIFGVARDITEKKLGQEKVVKAIIQTEEKERAYFSKELHDGLGPLLSTIKLYLQWSKRPNTEKSRMEIVQKAEEVLEDAIGTVREISNKLSPHLLINHGINSAIRNFVDKLKETSTLNITFESNLNRRLGEEREAAIYRVDDLDINNGSSQGNFNLGPLLKQEGVNFAGQLVLPLDVDHLLFLPRQVVQVTVDAALTGIQALDADLRIVDQVDQVLAQLFIYLADLLV